jgi:2-amino-4-hydroxy-6-hydroxymethyldihydropteridine diphosphokinase
MIRKIISKKISYGNTAYLGLGTNKSNRYLNLNKAVNMLKDFCTVKQTSQIYTSPCLDQEGLIMEQENPFLNAAVKIETELQAEQLLEKCQNIEKQFGRKVKAAYYEAREMDIDILLYNNEYINNENLVVPHRELLNRLFVIKPLLDFDKNFTIIDTVTGKETNLNEIVNNFCDLFKTKATNDKVCYLAKTFNLQIGQREITYDLSKMPLLMGIVNCTPDSFSGGMLQSKEDYHKILKNLKDNKGHFDIIDIGGESTRPGAKLVEQNVELDRVATLIRMIREDAELNNKPISIDTRKVILL